MPRIPLICSAVIYALSILGVALSPSCQSPGTEPAPWRSAATDDPYAEAVSTEPRGVDAPSVSPAKSAWSEPGGAARPPMPDQQLVGFTINLHQPPSLDRSLKALGDLKALGFNAVQITVPVFQRHGSSIRPTRPIELGKSPSDEQILTLLREARTLGLRPSLMFQINFTNPRGNEWRGKIQPPSWDVWWRDYQRLVETHAKLAQQGGAEVFAVGCELLSTHKPEHADRWRETIALAREHFQGRLVYSSTWDSYHRFPVWDALDFVGVSGWWDVTKHAADPSAPTADELAAYWQTVIAGLSRFGQKQGKPVLITEVGYPTLPWALKDPWNYVPKSGSKPTPEVQALGYAGLVQGWRDTIPPPGREPASENAIDDFAGMFMYEWQVWGEPGGPTDVGYSIENKPAEAVLRGWLDSIGN